MDRRLQDRGSDESGGVVSLAESTRNMSETFWRASMMYTLGDEEQRRATPEALLNRMLSTKSYISTHSSLAEANQRAAEDATQKIFTQIGKGQCGTVFALKGTLEIIKLANAPNKEDELYQDAKMHSAVEEAFHSIPSRLRQDINVPVFQGWVNPKSASFWNTKSQLFPKDISTPNYGLMSERIFPLPFPVREAIVDALCSKTIRKQKEAFLKQPENKDCLVRLYLGRRQENDKTDNVRLRNFPLHVNEVERLKLDTEMFARVMARALAVLHWVAFVDANDVEFVLGSSPTTNTTSKPTLKEIEASDKDTLGKFYHYDYDHRSISVWLIDFNQCREFEQTEQGMKQLVDGFFWNDPYYPRPGGTNMNDKKLWDVFSSSYIETSKEFGADTWVKGFISEVEKRQKTRSGGLFAN